MLFDLEVKNYLRSYKESSSTHDMKARIFALLLLISPMLTYAQQDAKAQEILKSVSTKFKSYKSYKANFSIIIENSRDKSREVQKGIIYIKGNKYRLEIAGQDVISDGKTRWTYVKDANEVQIDVQKTDENTISPTNIFTIYEKGWQSKYTGDAKDKTITYAQIELVPSEGKNKNIFKIKLSINKSDKSISSAKMLDKNGGTQTINVEKISPDGGADDAIYVFNKAKYPDAEIVDLR